jgi:hypothetical protein
VALTAVSAFSYGITVSEGINDKIDFINVGAGPQITATLRPGDYSLTTMALEVERAMIEADPTCGYAVTFNRTIGGGSANRCTIVSSGSYFEILFSSGTNNATSAATLLGFAASDYTGGLTYTGSASCGTVLVTSFQGFSFLNPTQFQIRFGAINISASGQKEAITFSVQQFWQVQFKYITKAEWLASWQYLMQWMTKQAPIEFMPEISDTATYYEGTLESTPKSSTGIEYKITEMLPQFPNNYDTGLMIFRVRPT